MRAAAAKFGIADIQVQLASQQVKPADFGFDLGEDYFQNVSGPAALTVSSAEENAFTLCAAAAEKLLAKYPDLIPQLDAIFVVTLPTEPTVAPISNRLQGHLGASAGTFCMDLTLSCCGFLQAASMVLDLMPARNWKRVLLLNVETLTKIIHPEDHALRLLLSDSAAATLFTDDGRMIFEGFKFFSEGEKAPVLCAREGHLYMNGPQLYETVLRRIPASVNENLAALGWKREDVDVFLFHQASKKVLDKLTQVLELNPDQVPRTIEQVGNLGSCSIPQILEGLLHDEEGLRKEKSGRKIFATAFGAGFQWAHATLHQES